MVGLFHNLKEHICYVAHLKLKKRIHNIFLRNIKHPTYIGCYSLSKFKMLKMKRNVQMLFLREVSFIELINAF